VIGRRKKSFCELYDLLRSIEADPGDLARVQRMNLLLLKEVLGAEKHILRHKASLKALKAELKTARASRETANAIRRKINRSESYLRGYYSQRYIWKCFGDGLAYAYLDKYAAKHAFFAIDSYEAKPSAGLLSGKIGMERELSLLRLAIERGVPAVLCDVTNVLRYGDVCLLGGADPYPIEVKSNPKLNQRGKRQAAALKRLAEFLTSDRAENFRAPGRTKRIAIPIPERNHQDVMNSCIAVAESAGHCIVHPEPGLTYIASYEQLHEHQLDVLAAGNQPVIFILNEDKRAGEWLIYEPFTRSIRGRQHLLDFVTGRLVIIVVFDLAVLCAAMQRPGWDVSIHHSVPAAIQFYHRKTGAIIGLSRQFLGRVGFEFVSPSWIAECFAPNIEELLVEMLSLGDEQPPSDDYDAIRIKMFGQGT
jgi:hypothetical protein